MAIAGKVAITPKGEWNVNTAYTKLDLVFYDNASYVAIQPSTGVEPTNTSYWMLVVQSAGGADLDGIISGDIQVGNAKTLDGHNADYFAPLSLLNAQKMDVGTDLDNCTEVGIYFFDSYATNYLNTPSNTAHNGIMVVKRRSNIRIVQEYTSVNTGITYTRTYGGTWRPWREVFTTDGGNVNGNVVIYSYEAENRLHYLQNSLRCVYQKVFDTGGYELYDKTNSKPIINSTADGITTFNGTASGNLPLSGGTVATDGTTPLKLKNNTGDALFLQMQGKSGVLGWFAMNGVNKPVFITADSTVYDFLHTGNKPTGTYTGNGSATARTINTGGIGRGMIVTGDGYYSLVTPSGAIYAYYGTNDSVKSLKMEECKYVEGVLTITTTNAAFNTNGVQYTYQVL